MRGIVIRALAFVLALALGFGAYSMLHRPKEGPVSLVTLLPEERGNDATELRELTVCNPAGSTGDVFLGRADVDEASGYRLSPGDCYTMRAVDQSGFIDTKRLYVSNPSGVELRIATAPYYTTEEVNRLIQWATKK